MNVSPRARREANLSELAPKPISVWALPICALVTIASVLGLVGQGVYDEETLNWATQARGQDVGNLVVVVTMLLSAYGYQRRSHRAGVVRLARQASVSRLGLEDYGLG